MAQIARRSVETLSGSLSREVADDEIGFAEEERAAVVAVWPAARLSEFGDRTCEGERPPEGRVDGDLARLPLANELEECRVHVTGVQMCDARAARRPCDDAAGCCLWLGGEVDAERGHRGIIACR
jgi:hypothetical protein